MQTLPNVMNGQQHRPSGELDSRASSLLSPVCTVIVDGSHRRHLMRTFLVKNRNRAIELGMTDGAFDAKAKPPPF